MTTMLMSFDADDPIDVLKVSTTSAPIPSMSRFCCWLLQVYCCWIFVFLSFISKEEKVQRTVSSCLYVHPKSCFNPQVFFAFFFKKKNFSSLSFWDWVVTSCLRFQFQNAQNRLIT